MLTIILLSLTAFIAAAPFLGLFMLVDAIRHPPEHVLNKGTVGVRQDTTKSGRTKVPEVMAAA